MATDIAGLFGLTPESYQLAQDQAAQEQAAKYASMNPFERASYGMFRSGQQIGGAIGQALGAQDPMLQQISQQQSLLKSIDFSNPDSIKQAISQASAINPQLAASLLGKYQESLLSTAKIGAEQALAEQRKREKQAADPIQQLIRTAKYTPASVAKYEKSGNVEDLENVDKADPTTLAETAEGIFLINKVTGEPIKKIGSAPQRGTNISPSFNLVDKESNLRKDFTQETNPIKQTVTSADRIEKLLNMGSLGEIIAKKQFSKLAGDNNISNKDVEALSNFGDLGQRLAGVLTGFFEGRYSEAQKQEALNLVRDLKTSSSAQYNIIKNQYRDRAAAENLPEKTRSFIAPDLSVKIPETSPLPPEGTRLRNKTTGKIEVVRNGKLVPEGQ
jgi:ribosomal protein S18